MPTKWDQAELQRYIDDGVEESLNLDYKAADALGTSDGKKKEITKDVSAMANSAGGVIIYGIKEYDQVDKKHLPENLTPIDRTQFSKEWLEQIINSIQPRITGTIIYPVDLNTGSDHVAYVVDIPQSTTAHQARDFRYYRRFNFESVPMNDYEVRDVMHRRTLPDVTVVFGYEPTVSGIKPCYLLKVRIKNQGVLAVEKFKLQFVFPVYDNEVTRSTIWSHHTCQGIYDAIVDSTSSDGVFYDVRFRSNEVLFPKDELDITGALGISYYLHASALTKLKEDQANEKERKLCWTLYADDMPPKSGEVSLSNLYNE